MTIQDLQHNYTWLAFLRMWEESGRCPIEAVDFLIDCDLWEEAEVIRTAATENRIFSCNSRFGSDDPTVGIYPCVCGWSGVPFVWYITPPCTSTDCCSIKGINRLDPASNRIESKTFVEAVQRLIEVSL